MKRLLGTAGITALFALLAFGCSGESPGAGSGVDARAVAGDAGPVGAQDAQGSEPDSGALGAPDSGNPVAADAAEDAREDAGVRPPRANDAVFVDQSLPASVTAGRTFRAHVRMRNRGTATWSRANAFFLGSTDPQDNFTWGTNRGWMDPSAVVPPGESYQFALDLVAPAMPGRYGMRWQMLQDAVEWFGEKSVPQMIEVMAPRFPGVDELRRFGGDFGGIYLPEIVPHCPEDPTTHIRCQPEGGGNPHGLLGGALFTPAYGVYSDAQRRAIRMAYRARRYTHFPISLDCGGGYWYHGLYPPLRCGQHNVWLNELWNDGLVPVCFVLPDEALSIDLGNLDRSLCKIVVPMWEMNGPLRNDTNRINQAIMFTRRAFPDALEYVHFTAQHAAGGSPEADWWSWATRDAQGPHLQGILYQDDRWNDPQAVRDRLADFLVRLGGGYHGWPHPVDIVLFETDIYEKFWGGRTEAQGVAFNNQVIGQINVPTCLNEAGTNYCGQLAGFCSGGTPR